jgi:hypothetical protein
MPYLPLYIITPLSTVLLQKLTGFAANQEIPHTLCKPESSLPYSQAPATCPYPEPTPSSPHNPLPLPKDPSLYDPPTYVLVSPMVSFPLVSPPKPCAHFSLPPYVPHVPPISFFSILSPAQYWVSSTDILHFILTKILFVRNSLFSC